MVKFDYVVQSKSKLGNFYVDEYCESGKEDIKDVIQKAHNYLLNHDLTEIRVISRSITIVDAFCYSEKKENKNE